MTSLAKPIRAFLADASPRDVLAALAENAAVVLVDDERKPIGVLTYSDTERLQKAVREARRAADLFELGREIFTVFESAPADEVARVVVQHGLKTGITAVDPDGRYAGYVFVRTLRGGLPDLKAEQNAVDRSLSDLKKEHPAPYERVDRLFKSGSKE